MDKKQILLIEENQSQALFSKTILEEVGYNVRKTNSGEQALLLIEDSPPDVIIINASHPEDGESVMVRHVRGKTQNYIPIIVLRNDRYAAKEDGIMLEEDDSLAESFDQTELIERIHRLVKNKERLDKLLASLSNEVDSYQEMKQIALYDQLTNLYHRNYFMDISEREFGMAVRYKTPIACIMADIDDFREFNHHYGHSVGDWILHEIGVLLKDRTRQGDILARYGGEEFSMLLPMTSLSAARELAERLRSEIENTIWKSPAGDVRITLSFGVAGLPQAKVSSTYDLLDLADRALYRAKAFGRNRVEIILGVTRELKPRD